MNRSFLGEHRPEWKPLAVSSTFPVEGEEKGRRRRRGGGGEDGGGEDGGGGKEEGGKEGGGEVESRKKYSV